MSHTKDLEVVNPNLPLERKRGRRRKESGELSVYQTRMLAYKKKYGLEAYSLMLDSETKQRFQRFCLLNNLSTAGVINSLLQDFLKKNEAKSVEA